ncbi:hypothetical protein B1C81_37545 [Streptomyces sp. HG99]|nr:hypothetical protein B1C81_37545 [Streptomyces sp. HG99]
MHSGPQAFGQFPYPTPPLAIYPTDAIEAHRAFIARRRVTRPTDEYRAVTKNGTVRVPVAGRPGFREPLDHVPPSGVAAFAAKSQVPQCSSRPGTRDDLTCHQLREGRNGQLAVTRLAS